MGLLGNIIEKYPRMYIYIYICRVLRIDDISIPTLCICSLDDPIANFKLIPHNECFVNENIILATYPVGSHLSYLTNTFSHVNK